MLAQAQVNALERTGKVQRLPASAANEAGVIIVTADLNHNGLTDHVGISLGDKFNGESAGAGYYWMVDNSKERPYRRNIGKGGRTPVLYVLRITV